MKIDEFRKLNDADLVSKISELRAQLFTLRLQQKAGQADNGKALHDARKDSARALTVQTERAHNQEAK